jgi:hypothetical protein
MLCKLLLTLPYVTADIHTPYPTFKIASFISSLLGCYVVATRKHVKILQKNMVQVSSESDIQKMSSWCA